MRRRSRDDSATVPFPMSSAILPEKRKQRILGLNAAALYGVKPREPRCSIAPDRIEQMQTALGGFREDRSLRTYGPRTRREFLALQRLG